MERNADISRAIRSAYDELINDRAFCDAMPNKLKKGLFIDPFISSAKAQKVASFIHQYCGTSDDKIISISDIFCQKLYAICCVSAKLLTEGGIIKFDPNNNLVIGGHYHIEEESFKKIVAESGKYLKEQREIFKKGESDFSEKIIKEIDECANQYINSELNYLSTALFTSSAIKMLILHEYFHIINNDKESAPLDVKITQEKKADIDAFNRLKEKENNIASYIGALCLQSSGLFLNDYLESLLHPDVDNRIEYIYNICDQEENERNIFSDILKLYVNLWAKINEKETDFLSECDSPTPKDIFNFLKKEKEKQSSARLEEGRKEMMEQARRRVKPKYATD